MSARHHHLRLQQSALRAGDEHRGQTAAPQPGAVHWSHSGGGAVDPDGADGLQPEGGPGVMASGAGTHHFCRPSCGPGTQIPAPDPTGPHPAPRRQ